MLKLGLIGLSFLINTVQALPNAIPIHLSLSPSRRSIFPRAPTNNGSSIPLNGLFVGTDIEWTGPIQVGTPPQNIPVRFTTENIFQIRIADLSCTNCITTTKFNSSASSTFKPVTSGNSSFQFGQATGVDPTLVPLSMTVQQVQDTVTIGGLPINNTGFERIVDKNITSTRGSMESFVSLGFNNGGPIVRALSALGLPPIFTFYLTPFSSSTQAELTLGAIDTAKFSGEVQYSQSVDVASSETWNLPLGASPVVEGGGGETVIDGLLNKGQMVQFSTSTPNLVFPQAFTEAVYKAISPLIKPNPSLPGTYTIPCSALPTIQSNLTFSFPLVNSANSLFNLTIPSSELSVGPIKSDPSLCQTYINAGSPAIGAVMFKHYYTVWDLKAQQIGFAKLSSYTNSSSIPPTPPPTPTPNQAVRTKGPLKNAGLILSAGFVGMLLL